MDIFAFLEYRYLALIYNSCPSHLSWLEVHISYARLEWVVLGWDLGHEIAADERDFGEDVVLDFRDRIEEENGANACSKAESTGYRAAEKGLVHEGSMEALGTYRYMAFLAFTP